MRLLLLALWLCGCDPQLAMSGEPLTKRTVDDCPEALERLRQCCPRYESYLSCTVMEKWEGAGTADLSHRESRCLRSTECGAIEKAVVGGEKLCGIEFRGHLCKEAQPAAAREAGAGKGSQ